jgi:hypothetical protein
MYNYGGSAPPPDPVPVRLIAFLYNRNPTIPPVYNRLQLTLKFAPVGEVPEVVQADITLEVP